MHDQVRDLLQYLDSSVTPFHAIAETAKRLQTLGFRALDEANAWETRPGDKVFVVRGGSSLAAFVLGSEPPTETGFRLVGAHSDSPNLRLKPNPELRRAGFEQLGVEPYGGVLLHTWLDRDLSLAGRVVLLNGAVRLLDFGRPLLRIPSLAIHLDRTVNKDGLTLNPQTHMAPVAALSDLGNIDLRRLLSEELEGGVRAEDILGWDLMLYPAEPAALGGLRAEFIHSARLDNIASCHAGLCALSEQKTSAQASCGIVLYDHEEVGSRSAQGAASNFLKSCLQRLIGGGPDSYQRALARSFLISLDMAHAVHPNYADRHEPQHQPQMGKGPVIKINVNQSYATDGESWARFEACARAADVGTQRFVVRSDTACGSTIGPISAAELGIRTVDAGNPMLSMHSAREMAAAADVPKMIAVLRTFFSEQF